MKTSTEKSNSSLIIKLLETVLASKKVVDTLLPAFDESKTAVIVTWEIETKRKVSPNWITMWNSLKVGGAAKFPEDFKKIKESFPPKTSHFTIMKALRDLKEKDGSWKIWWEKKVRTGTLGVDVPEEHPKDHKPNETTTDSSKSPDSTTTDMNDDTVDVDITNADVDAE